MNTYPSSESTIVTPPSSRSYLYKMAPSDISSSIDAPTQPSDAVGEFVQQPENEGVKWCNGDTFIESGSGANTKSKWRNQSRWKFPGKPAGKLSVEYLQASLPKQKTRREAVILAALFGWTGFHRLYIGDIQGAKLFFVFGTIGGILTAGITLAIAEGIALCDAYRYAKGALPVEFESLPETQKE